MIYQWCWCVCVNVCLYVCSKGWGWRRWLSRMHSGVRLCERSHLRTSLALPSKVQLTKWGFWILGISNPASTAQCLCPTQTKKVLHNCFWQKHTFFALQTCNVDRIIGPFLEYHNPVFVIVIKVPQLKISSSTNLRSVQYFKAVCFFF